MNSKPQGNAFKKLETIPLLKVRLLGTPLWLAAWSNRTVKQNYQRAKKPIFLDALSNKGI